MNCEQVQLILNDAANAELKAADTDDLRSHLAGCASCNEEWQTQALLGAMPVPPLSADLASRIRTALPGDGAAARGTHAGRAWIVGGLLVVGAAAAVVLVSQTPDSDPVVATAADPSMAVEAVSALPSDDAATDDVTAADASPVPGGDASAVAEASAPSNDASSINLDPSWVVVLPVPNDLGPAAFLAMANERRALVIRRLDETQGLNTVDADLVQSYAAAGLSDVEIARTVGAGKVIIPVVTERDGVFTVRFDTLDMSTDFVLAGPEMSYPTPRAPNAQMAEYVWNNNLTVSVDGIYRDAYPDLAETAEQQTTASRQTILDQSRSEAERLAALRDLRVQGSRGMDSVVLEAALALAESSDDPRTRQNVWITLMEVDDPVLIQPLLRTLAYDSSPAVRREAAAQLARFSDAPMVQAALQYAQSNDADAAVRDTASVSKLSEDERLARRRDRFFDPELPATERMMELNIGFVDARKGPRLAMDDAIARELLDIAQDTSDRDARGLALTVLYYGKAIDRELALDPELRHPLMRLFREDPDPSIRGGAALALNQFVDQPDVREALEYARDHDEERSIRNNARRALEFASENEGGP